MSLAAPVLGPSRPGLFALWTKLPPSVQLGAVVAGCLAVMACLLFGELLPSIRNRRWARVWGAGAFYSTWLLVLAAVSAMFAGAPAVLAPIAPVTLVVRVLWLAGLKPLLKSSRGRRILHRIVTGISLVAFGALLTWSQSFANDRSSVFNLAEQAVRVGAALSGTAFLLSMMLHLSPWALDALEGHSFIQFVAARHVRSTKSNFLTAISFLSIAGVAISSLVLCIVISIMTGFGADLKRKILGNNAQVRVETQAVGGFDNWRSTLDAVRATPGIKAATPVAAGEVMASSRTNTAGVLLKGIDSDTIPQVVDLVENIEVGNFAYLNDERKLANLPPDEVIWLAPGGQKYLKGSPMRWIESSGDTEVDKAVKGPEEFPGIILGKELAKSLHVYVGEDLSLVSPMGDLGPMGIMPRSRRFRVAAIFYSGMYEYDAAFAYVKIEQAQSFLDLGPRITEIDARVDESDRAPEVRSKVVAAIARPDLKVRDWQEVNRQLFSALKLEKLATFIILSIAILVASFCIVCTLLLMVTEKSKEIAILKSLGASDRVILSVFMVEGMIIGAIGTVYGVATGLALTLGLKHFGVRLDPEVYYVDRLPINVELMDYCLVALCSMVITTLATIYPALAASRLRPVEGIRYE